VTDRRLTPANGRAALDSLRGTVDAPRHVPGEPARIAIPLVDLDRAPGGPRDRQLLLGDGVTVIDRAQAWAFVQAAKDGYCGYVPEAALGAAQAPTHRVIAPATHLYPLPKVQAHELCALSFGSLLTVTGTAERFAETPDGFVPLQHLRALADPLSDPGAVAALEQRVRRDGVPFLGICVGMQLMASRGLEHGSTPGLDWLPRALYGRKALLGTRWHYR
jgi:hypothetical protein